MKCILEDSYKKEQFNTIKEALESAIIMWEYNTSHPNCIKKLDGTIVKTEEDIYKCYNRWWNFVYGFSTKKRIEKKREENKKRNKDGFLSFDRNQLI